jgi:acetoin utilization protein AcuB
MIVRDIMTTQLVTVEPDDTLGHAVKLLKHHLFHHLPVVRTVHIPKSQHEEQNTRQTALILEGVLTSQDIDMVAATSQQGASGDPLQRPWQERLVVEFMHRASIHVTPPTPLAAAAQILAERNMSYLPVIEYVELEHKPKAILVGLITRNDLLFAMARTLGATEPGMQIDIELPSGDMAPLAQTLHIAAELHMQIRSIIAAPLVGGAPRVATLRLGTIHPTPLLMRLQEAGIVYSSVDPLAKGETHG